MIYFFKLYFFVKIRCEPIETTSHPHITPRPGDINSTLQSSMNLIAIHVLTLAQHWIFLPTTNAYLTLVPLVFTKRISNF